MSVTQATYTGSAISASVATYYEKKLLSRLVPQLHLYPFGKSPSWVIPGRSGKTCVWTRYTKFSAATTALTEGTTPSGHRLSSANVSATVAGYGDYDLISDFVDVVAIDPILENAADGVFADQAALTVDTLIRNALSAGTAMYAAGRSAISSITASDVLAISAVRNAVRGLERNDVRPHRLTPGYFPLFVHPDTKYDLVGDSTTGGWIDVRKYTESHEKEIELNKIGEFYGAKGFVTSNIYSASDGSSNAYCYRNLMFGDEAFGVTEISGLQGGGNIKIIVHQPGSGGALDPLNQQGSIGWKAYLAVALLDSTRAIVLNTGASQNS